MNVRSASEDGGRVPRLALGRDVAALPLSPAEGYLLSRVDGRTPWSVLLEIGGLPAGDVDACLRRWLEQGWLEVGGAAAAAAPASEDELLDPSLDLPVEAQERILAFEAQLDRPYHELLGISRQADAKAVKRAYFELSKEFHPDRYFRREIGPYAARLSRVFARIAEAYELLSDPATRVEVDRGLDAAPARAAAPAGAPASAPPISDAAGAARRARAALQPARLRQLAERKGKAKRFFEAGMTAFQSERWCEAAASIRLAIAFDPANQAFKDAFGPVQRKASDERGRHLVHEAETAFDHDDLSEALRLYEEALVHRPHDPQANFQAARLLLHLGEEPRRAKEYAARACELVPDSAQYRRLLGKIYRSAGLVANARRELEAALRLDPNDGAIRAELRELA